MILMIVRHAYRHTKIYLDKQMTEVVRLLIRPPPTHTPVGDVSMCQDRGCPTRGLDRLRLVHMCGQDVGQVVPRLPQLGLVAGVALGHGGQRLAPPQGDHRRLEVVVEELHQRAGELG